RRYRDGDPAGHGQDGRRHLSAHARGPHGTVCRHHRRGRLGYRVLHQVAAADRQRRRRHVHVASSDVTRQRSIALPALALGCSDPTSRAVDGAAAPYPRPEYAALSDTGVYADLESHTLADSLRGFAPSFVLWADGAEKQRWLSLPRGSQI